MSKEYSLFPLAEDRDLESSPWFILYRLMKPFYMRIKPGSYFVSFPKSGRTWLRIFLARYQSQYFGTPFQTRMEAPPFSFKPQVLRTFARVVFHHVGYKQMADVSAEDRKISIFTQKHINDRVVFMVRDPRDVAVSYYYHSKKRSQAPGVAEMTMSEFIRHDVYGLPRIIHYMNKWANERASLKHCEIFYYEALRTQPETEFRRLLTFLDIPIDETVLEEAIAYSSFDNMKELETKNALDDFMLQAADQSDPNSFQVRKGKVGGYREELSSDDLAYADDIMKTLDASYGY